MCCCIVATNKCKIQPLQCIKHKILTFFNIGTNVADLLLSAAKKYFLQNVALVFKCIIFAAHEHP